jgi:hypothetical protein
MRGSVGERLIDRNIEEVPVNSEDIAAVSQAARSFLPPEFIKQLEGHFFQSPSIVLGLLWAMSEVAGGSRSEPGRKWKAIADHLKEAKGQADSIE